MSLPINGGMSEPEFRPRPSSSRAHALDSVSVTMSVTLSVGSAFVLVGLGGDAFHLILLEKFPVF